MYCPKCGSPNDDKANHCVQCGEALVRVVPPPPQAQPPQQPQQQLQPLTQGRPAVPSHLAPAILTTLFCCLPLGVVAIVFAAQVSGKVAAGDHEGALAASRQAKIWSWVSFGVGMGAVLIYVLLFAIGIGAGLLKQP